VDAEADPHRAPTEDHAAVAKAMAAYTGRADYSLQVVTTTSASGEPSGCVVGFITQCSIAPPRLLVCISKVNHTYFASESSDAVAVHLIGRDQIQLASLFAEESGDTVDKFSQCAWHYGITGSPVLSECAAWLETVIISRTSVGDHEALLVRPVAGGPGTYQSVLTIQGAPKFRPGHPADG
jgi:flavin reductase (DIM6/NTAB) family NADH-FMN oxidoreductase RutF